MRKGMYIALGILIALMAYEFVHRAIKNKSTDIVDSIISENPNIKESFYDVNQKETFYFEQIGYFKQNKNRVMTYCVTSSKPINLNNIPNIMWNEIRSHASAQMHTTGKITQVLYYLDKYSTPDPTLANDYFAAIEMVYKAKPICAYSKNIDDEVLFEKFPE